MEFNLCPTEIKVMGIKDEGMVDLKRMCKVNLDKQSCLTKDTIAVVCIR